MTATVVFAPIQADSAESAEFTQLSIYVNARIISAVHAKRIANGWLLWNIGERIAVGSPELVLDERLLWRFPLRWTAAKTGVLAELAVELRINALTGEVLADESTSIEIHACVQHAASTIQVTAN